MELFDYKQICTLNKKEFEVYNYISSHIDKIMQMNIRQLSVACGVSTTTILRFCQKMDFMGYTELKYHIKCFFEGNNVEKQKKFDLDPVLQYLYKMEHAKETEQIIQKIADVCVNAKNIYIIGDSVSSNLAAYGAYMLTYVGKMALVITDIEYPYPLNVLEETVLIVLSISGKNCSLMSQINHYKQQKARIFSITNTDECPLARMSELNLSYFMPTLLVKDQSKELNLISQIPTVYILERIAYEVHQILIQNQQK